MRRTLACFVIVAAAFTGCAPRPHPDDDLERHRAAAESGDRLQQIFLAEHYRLGRGMEQDLAGAFRWSMRAAAAGDAEAQYQVGLAYRSGAGVPRDIMGARTGLRKAADQNHVAAIAALKELEDEVSRRPRDGGQ